MTFYSKKSAAILLHVTTRTIENWMRRGVLPLHVLFEIVFRLYVPVTRIAPWRQVQHKKENIDVFKNLHLSARRALPL
jgi:hypothetical protein